MALTSLRRLMREHKQMTEKPIREFVAYPLEENAYEWHFTMTGPPDSPYAEGLYHGRVIVPAEYPFAPPDVMLLTPNGRFELEKVICLSISSYHPENWHATWGIATVLHALREFMLTPGHNAIGAIHYPEEVRKKMATESRTWTCKQCKQCTANHWTVMALAPPATEADKPKLPQLPDEDSLEEATPTEEGKGREEHVKEETQNGVQGEPKQENPHTVVPPQQELQQEDQEQNMPQNVPVFAMRVEGGAVEVNISLKAIDTAAIIFFVAFLLLMARKIYANGIEGFMLLNCLS